MVFLVFVIVPLTPLTNFEITINMAFYFNYEITFYKENLIKFLCKFKPL